jgi:hypothetical protein
VSALQRRPLDLAVPRAADWHGLGGSGGSGGSAMKVTAGLTGGRHERGPVGAPSRAAVGAAGRGRLQHHSRTGGRDRCQLNIGLGGTGERRAAKSGYR